MMFLNKFQQNLLHLGLLFLLTCCSPQLYKTGTGEHFAVNEQVKPSPEVDTFIQSYKMRLEEEMNTVIGETSEAILKNGQGETALGNLVADYQKAFAEMKLGIAIDISIMNNGGIRNNLPEGPITLGNIYELSPFDNYLYVLELNSENVKELAAFAASRRILGIAGMSIVTKNGVVTEIKINGELPLPGRTYLLAVNDYLANGGDGMEMLTLLPRKMETDYLLREILITQIKSTTKKGQKITASIEGRQKLD